MITVVVVAAMMSSLCRDRTAGVAAISTAVAAAAALAHDG